VSSEHKIRSGREGRRSDSNTLTVNPTNPPSVPSPPPLVPLEEAKQSWSFMKPEFRKKVRSMLTSYKDEYGLNDVEVEGFKMVTGFNSTVSSTDVAFAVRGILDAGAREGR